MRWLLLVFLLMLCALASAVWFAPAIVARTSLVQRLVARNTSDFAATVSVGRVSLGWLSPIVVRDVVVNDLQGQPLAQVATVSTEKSLFACATDARNLGGIVLEQPRLQILLKSDGTNLEDALKPWLAQAGPPADVGCTVEIREGVVEILDQASGERWLAEGVNASVSAPRDRQQPLAVRAQLAVRSPNDPPAPGTIELALPRARDGSTGGANAGQIAVRTSPLSLRLASAVARRWAPELRLDGAVAGDLAARWDGARLEARAESLRAERFVLANPAWLGTDTLRLTQVDARGEVSRESGTWSVRDLRLVSDVGTMELNGSAAPPAAGSSQGWLSALLAANLRGKADVDLARLAALLPHTFRVREATQIASGRATAELASQPQGAGHAWDGKVLVHNLSAVHQGRTIAWDQPVELVVAALRQGAAWNVRQLTCRSSFLNLSAQGSWTAGTAQLAGDLSRFAKEVSQFADLGQVRLAGQVTAEAEWRSDTRGQVTLSGRGAAQALDVVVPGCRPLREEKLQMEIAASGRLASGRVTQLDQGRIQLVSAQDQLAVELQQPASLDGQTAWPLRLHAEGQLGTWLPRVQSFVPFAGWELAGAVTLDAEGRGARELIDAKLVQLNVRDLAARGGSVVIREPAVQIETAGVWDRAAGEIRANALTLASTSVALRAADVRAQWKGEQVALAGDATYRVQLERALAWWEGSQQQPLNFRVAGETTGRLQLTTAGGVTAGKCTAEVANFAYATRAPANAPQSAQQAGAWQTVWNEPRLQVAAAGEYDSQKTLLSLSELRVAGQALSAAATGTIREPADRCHLDLQGSVAYDLQQLMPRLSPQVAAQLRMAGSETRPFRLAGPLFTAAAAVPAGGPPIRQASTGAAAQGALMTFGEMRGQASVGWQSVSAAGLTIGPGNLETQLADGIVTVTPLDLPLSEGKIHLAPKIDLTKTPATLTQGAGPLVEQVRLTPEMCRGWLKFVAPLIAEATAAEGQFSVSLQGAAAPLANLAGSEVQGVLKVHAARVGPGPLSQQLLTVAEQVKAIAKRQVSPASSNGYSQWLELPAQEIPFQMVNGRVHHEGLQLTIGDVVVRTKGSVGLDESLALVAEVPLRDEWVQNDRYLSSLRGQTLQLPVQGSLGQPRIDTQTLAGLTRQTMTGAASQLLQQELGRGLERWLGPQGRQTGTTP